MTGVDLLEALMSISNIEDLDEILKGYQEALPEYSREELKSAMLDNASDSSEVCAEHVKQLLIALLTEK